jgi:predicted nucleotidyltransferase
LFFCVRKIWTQDSTRRGQGCQGMMMDVEKLSRHLQDSMPDLQAIYLFGSYVSGDFQSHSDLDVAILLKTKCNPVVLWQLSGELADIAGVPVDLVDLRAASTIMQYQVITTGRRIWVADSSVGLFEAFVLSEKTDLDAARAGLLEDVQKEGLIHGR